MLMPAAFHPPHTVIWQLKVGFFLEINPAKGGHAHGHKAKQNDRKAGFKFFVHRRGWMSSHGKSGRLDLLC